MERAALVGERARRGAVGTVGPRLVGICEPKGVDRSRVVGNVVVADGTPGACAVELAQYLA